MIKMKIKKPDSKELIKNAGLRYSRQRELILDVLLQSQKPLTATDILAEIEEMKLKERYWLSTIYRTLDYLIEARLLTRIDFPDSSEAAYIAKVDSHDQHYAICLDCHRIIPLRYCPLEDVLRQLSTKGFRTQAHRLEIFGYCNECQQLRAQKRKIINRPKIPNKSVFYIN